MLHDVIRETYARAKDAEDRSELERVAEWGAIAENMRMSEATREEILSTVVRAKIRLGEYEAADGLLEKMSRRGNRSVLFLRGHSLRRQERYEPAIKLLEEATQERKYKRSALHELALAYKKSGKNEKLRKLLEEHQELIRDSAMFSDFQISVDLARGNIPAAEARIESLARMPDDDGRSDIRRAQLFTRKGLFKEAANLLSTLLREQYRDRFRIRALRAYAAARDKNFALARQDIDFIKSMPNRQDIGLRLEANFLIEKGDLTSAGKLLEQVQRPAPEDELLRARIYEQRADLAETNLVDREKLKAKAIEIRVQHRFAFEYADYED